MKDSAPATIRATTRRVARHPLVAGSVILGVLLGCELFGSDNQTPNYFFAFNPSSVTLEVGQTVTIGFSSSADPNVSMANPAIAEIVSSTSTSVTIRGVAVGTTQLLGYSYSASAVASVTVVPATGQNLPTGTRSAPHGQTEGLQVLAPGPTGTTAFGPWADRYVAAVAGQGGWSAVDLITGEVLHTSSGLSGSLFGVAAASQDPPGPTSTAGFVAFGNTGYSVQNVINGTFTATQIGFGTTYDASMAGGRKISNIFQRTQPGSGVGFVQFDGTANAYLTTTEIVPAPPSGELVSSYLHNDQTAFGGSAPILMLTRAVQSLVWLNRRDGSASTTVLTLGLDARKLRCIQVAGGGALCGVTLFGADRVTMFTWDGAESVTFASDVAVGDGPVDLDLRLLPSGNVAMVTTGFNNGAITEAELTPAGVVVNTESSAVPAGCTGAGHAVYIRDAAGLKIVGTCYSSSQYYIVASGL